MTHENNLKTAGIYSYKAFSV